MSQTIGTDLEKVWDTPAAPAGRCPFSDVGARFDPFDHASMHASLAEARSAEPVFFSPELGYWVVTRYDDVLSILRDPARFSAANANTPITPVPADVLAMLRDGGYALEGIQVNCDPPRHTRIRNLASQLLSVKNFNRLEPAVRDIVTKSLDELEALPDKRGVDLVAKLTYELPAKVIFTMLGIPEADAAQVKQWSTNRLLLSFSRPSHAEQADSARNLLAFWHYCVALVAKRIDKPEDDYASQLLRLRNGDDSVLTINEINSAVFGLLFAGHETTTSQATNLLNALLEDRTARDALRADPSLIPNAVEEGLRMYGAVANWRRRTLADVLISGVEIPAGSNLVISFAAANRDPAIFENPDRFDVHRANSRRHLTFGNGIHMCLGAPLARMEMKLLVEQFLVRFPDCVKSPGAEVEYARAFAFRAPHSLTVDLQEN